MKRSHSEWRAITFRTAMRALALGWTWTNDPRTRRPCLRDRTGHIWQYRQAGTGHFLRPHPFANL